MKDPINDLQDAIIHWLKNADDVTALVGDRIYDRVEKNAPFPYISIGPADQINEIADCFDIATVTIQIDCWSQKPGFYQAREVAKAVIDTLHDREIVLDDNALVSMTLVTNRSMRDPDGLTSHSAITFTADIQQNHI